MLNNNIFESNNKAESNNNIINENNNINIGNNIDEMNKIKKRIEKKKEADKKIIRNIINDENKKLEFKKLFNVGNNIIDLMDYTEKGNESSSKHNIANPPKKSKLIMEVLIMYFIIQKINLQILKLLREKHLEHLF